MRLLVIAIFVFLSAQAWSCSCMRLSFEDRVSFYDTIFLAQLIKAEIVPGSESGYFNREHINAQFEVIEVLKGNSIELFTGKTNLSLLSCGLSMEVGARYLVFNKHGSDDVGICTGTKKISSDVYEVKKSEILEIMGKASNNEL